MIDNSKGDLISRKALMEELESIPIRNQNVDWVCGIITAIERVEKIDSVPDVFTLEDMQNNFDLGATSEAAKHDRQKGEWIFKHNSSDIWCSVCDENFDEIPQAFNFCPNCGADMRKEGEEDG